MLDDVVHTDTAQRLFEFPLGRRPFCFARSMVSE
jgi:hypothetical protein